MKRTSIINFTASITSVAAFMSTGLVYAQSNNPVATPKIDQTQAQQQARIQQGAANGSLTSQEQAKLNAQQNQISQNKATAKADGVVTHGERKHLKHQQKRADKAIAKKKHNTTTAQ